MVRVELHRAPEANVSYDMNELCFEAKKRGSHECVRRCRGRGHATNGRVIEKALNPRLDPRCTLQEPGPRFLDPKPETLNPKP